ncbi:MAG TPA: membrane dipeptidase [Myxococcota bacterium]|nr:membrane dipeptidase [Myxococcota bacterium]HRY93116.1 membrane dipeptidase [Myxococcota bacterium]HSA23918.1 membrane dipeptidase [Myxococcota bacterium]
MDRQLLERATLLMESTPVVDVHSHFLINGHYLGKDFTARHGKPWLWNPLRNTLDLPRLREGRVSCSTFTVYVPPPPLRWSAWSACQRMLDTLERIVAQAPEELVKVDTAAGVRAAHAEGKLAVLPAVEGGHVLGKRLERVAELRRRGVRLLTLTHFISNRICDAHLPPEVHGGLSAFGREVLRACEEQGVAVDLAHASERTLDQALDLLRKPPVVTHTALRGARSSQRYLTPEQAKAVADRRGAIGVILWPWYLANSVLGGLSLVVDTLAELAALVGSEHLMIGSDMDGYTWLPRDLGDVAGMPRLTAAMLARGFSDEDVKNILGKTALRILQEWEA